MHTVKIVELHNAIKRIQKNLGKSNILGYRVAFGKDLICLTGATNTSWHSDVLPSSGPAQKTTADIAAASLSAACKLSGVVEAHISTAGLRCTTLGCTQSHKTLIMRQPEHRYDLELVRVCFPHDCE